MIPKKIETATTISFADEEEFSIPLDISDIINICKEYSNLGQNIQNYIDLILEDGLDQSISSGKLNKLYIPYIKSFLQAITTNPLFGDARSQSIDILNLIDTYEKNNKNVVNLFIN